MMSTISFNLPCNLALPKPYTDDYSALCAQQKLFSKSNLIQIDIL